MLAEQAASGLPPSVFARQAGIDVQRLHRWRRQLLKARGRDRRANGPAEQGRTTSTSVVAPTFLEVHPQRAEPVEVVLRSGRVLRVSEQIDEVVLLRLVEILERSGLC